MFCPNCGARNSEADTNCQKCGFNLKEQAGAKFKGTMLMMNNASAMAAELRRSAPPGAAQPPAAAPTPAPMQPGAAAYPPGNPPPADSKTSLSPEAAKQMRAQLKGTMIGVAPPALGAVKPPVAAPGVTVPRPSSRPPAPMGAAPVARQPGPGQVNAPGAGLSRGGGTMIGTGIAPSGLGPMPTPPPPGAVPVSTGAATEAFPISGEMFGGPPADNQAFDRTHVSPSAPPVPAAPPAVQMPSPAAFPGTQVMHAFDPFPASPPSPAQDPALSGTLVAGSAYQGSPFQGPSTVNTTNEAHFSPQAGQRTNTPPMGVQQAAYSPTEPAPPAGNTLPVRRDTPPSKAMVITLTVLTCGLYWVYQKFMAKNG